jgi:hypothetical protein
MISLAPDHDVPLRSSGLNLGTTCRRFTPMDVELRLDFIYLFILQYPPTFLLPRARIENTGFLHCCVSMVSGVKGVTM